MPLDIGSGSDMGVVVDGYQAAAGEEIDVHYNRVGPRYFETMGIPLVAGRAIDDRDVEGRQLSVVINETMARATGLDSLRSADGPVRLRARDVVGIAQDGKYRQLNEQPRNYMYVPLSQYFRPDALLIVRTAGDPAPVITGIQAQVKELDPNLPLFDVRTIEEHMT